MTLFIMWFQINGLLLFPIIAGGLFMSVLSKQSDKNLRDCFGWNSVVVTGAIGTPIHELSHMIVAILFGFKITDVKLFCPISGKKTGVLGYVSYKYRKTFWGKIGSFFVGIAPMIGGSAVIYGLFRVLLPNLATQVKQIKIDNFEHVSIDDILAILKKVILQMNDRKIYLVIFLILLIMISMHMSISVADLKNASYGAVYLEVLLLGITIILTIMNRSIIGIVWECTKVVWIIMGIGLIAAIISFCISAILHRIFA